MQRHTIGCLEPDPASGARSPSTEPGAPWSTALPDRAPAFGSSVRRGLESPWDSSLSDGTRRRCGDPAPLSAPTLRLSDGRMAAARPRTGAVAAKRPCAGFCPTPRIRPWRPCPGSRPGGSSGRAPLSPHVPGPLSARSGLGSADRTRGRSWESRRRSPALCRALAVTVTSSPRATRRGPARAAVYLA